MKFIADREDDSQMQIDASANNNNRKPSPSEGYTPPTNLYAFPPNIDSVYPPPGEQRKPSPIPNYLPPLSGPTNYPIYPGPVIPKPNPSLNLQDSDENAGPNMNDGNDNADSGSPDRPSDDMQIFDKPLPEFFPGKEPEVPSLPFLDHDHHNHDHDHDLHIGVHPPLAPFDDSLKHLHGFDAFPGTLVFVLPFLRTDTKIRVPA